MFFIRIFRIFIQSDTNTSLQSQMTRSKGKDADLVKLYNEIVKVSDSIKFKKRLSWQEKLLAARHYKSLMNELTGKTLRYTQYKVD